MDSFISYNKRNKNADTFVLKPMVYKLMKEKNFNE